MQFFQFFFWKIWGIPSLKNMLRVASGDWRVAGDEWRVAGGEWRVVGSEWRVVLSLLG